MIRALFRLVVLVVLVIGIAAFFFGYRWGTDDTAPVERPTATSGAEGPIDRTRAREAGAQVGEVVATGANEARTNRS